MNLSNEEIRKRVLKGLELSAKKLIKFKKEKKSDLVISENSVIKRIKSEDL